MTSLRASLIERLSRTTSSGRYIPDLDGLRFIAIAAVFLQHLQQVLAGTTSQVETLDLGTRLIAEARIGVELFFVISGFILGLPFAALHLLGEKRVNLRAYYLRRLTRLEPPYILSLVLFLALKIGRGASPGKSLQHFFASLFYVHNVIFGAFHPASINAVTWSLEVEVQFYLLAPLLAGVFAVSRKSARRSLIAFACVMSFVARHVLEARLGPLPPTLLTYLPYFGMGFLLADIYNTDWQKNPRRTVAWDLLAIPGWLLLPFIFLFAIPAATLVVSGALFGLIYASLRSVHLRSLLASAPIRIAGGMCYSFYLLHLPLLRLWGSTLSRPISGSSVWVLMLLAIPVGLSVWLITLIFFVLIEKPCMSLQLGSGKLATAQRNPPSGLIGGAKAARTKDC